MKINAKTLKNKADIILQNAYNEAAEFEKKQAVNENFIRKIILGSHKTFRYILFTALLAKASDPNINTLSLQANADILGAYDARSLCHKTVVPFEKKYLEGALGNANEPYLNKPARYPTISKDNSVRAGQDRALLELLCDELPKINDSDSAYSSLVFALQILIEKRDSLVSTKSLVKNIENKGHLDILALIDKLLDIPSRGEMLILSVATTLKYFYRNDVSVRIEAHKANQSGASSKEISDLDIYKNNKVLSLFELKDKAFNQSDIMHAVYKARNAGCTSMNFIAGRKATWNAEDISLLQEELFADGFILNLVTADNFIYTLLELVDEYDFTRFIDLLDEIKEEANISQSSNEALINTIKNID